MRVVCISGKAGSGKDEVAQAMKETFEGYGENVLIVHFADLLKFICEKFFDWDGKKDEAGRTLLQYVGTNKIRSKSPDFWVDFIANMLEMFDDEWDYVLIPDCRFPNEFEVLAFYGFDVNLVRVNRPAYMSCLQIFSRSIHRRLRLMIIRGTGSLRTTGRLKTSVQKQSVWHLICCEVSGIDDPV